MSMVIGLFAVVVAALFFGSNFVPTKTFDVGDGMFFQLVMCLGVWLVGVVVHIIQDAPPVVPFAMLGGGIWATGNMFCVPVIHMLGMGKGLLLWSVMGSVVGWANGRWGYLYGLAPQAVNIPSLNYLGVCVSIAALALYTQVKPTMRGAHAEPEADAVTPAASSSESTPVTESSEAIEMPVLAGTTHRSDGTVAIPMPEKAGQHQFVGLAKLVPQRYHRVFATSLTMFMGVFFGFHMVPVQYMIDSRPDATHNMLDYAFSHYSGALFTSACWFILYSIVMRNKPSVSGAIFLPGLTAGLMWGIAQAATFVCTEALSFLLAYPLVTVGPGVVSALWGVLKFKEIQGKRNLLFLGAAFAMSFSAAGLLVASNM